jgi:hypothetical protein
MINQAVLSIAFHTEKAFRLRAFWYLRMQDNENCGVIPVGEIETALAL